MHGFVRKLELRQIRLALLGIGAILTAAVIAGLLAPEIKAVSAARREVALLEEASHDGEDLQRRLENQRLRIADLQYQLHGDMADLPVRQIEAYIIGQLQRISWNNRVELVSVEPALGERVQVFQEMLFNVRLIGQYEDLYRWLWQARQDLGYVVVKEYGLARNDNNDEQPSLVANLSLASYRAVQ